MRVFIIRHVPKVCNPVKVTCHFFSLHFCDTVQLTDVGYILRVKLGQNADQRRILQFPGQNVSTERVPAASLARLAAGSSIGLTNT